jgi:hypothetical protein
VRTYLTSLAFIVDGGVARRRAANDPRPVQPHWNTVRGAFLAAQHLRLAINATDEVLRGSSVPIAAAFVHALGVSPGERTVFRTLVGDVTITWPLWSTNGPRFTAIGALARAHGCVVGDTLVLSFRPGERKLGATRIPAGVSARDMLTQATDSDVLTRETVAASLECGPDDSAAILTRRGDTDLASVPRELRSAPAPRAPAPSTDR